MNKLILAVISVVWLPAILTGCKIPKPSPPEPADEIPMNYPEALQDCKTFRVYGEHGFVLIMTRCPKSTTTVRYGKSGETTLVD